VIVLLLLACAPPGPGFHSKVKVSEPTRLDWTFVVSTQSLAMPPADWLGDYDSTAQTYDLFVPRGVKRPPAILFISPGNDAGAYRSFEKLVKARGFVFAAPHNAGNAVNGRRRVRIVLDVLDDLRRNHDIDPDRTYLAGFSGGGRIACAIGFALPDAVGGVMPLCASGTLRDEPWLRQRVLDRLSIAVLTGEKDFNRGEVERLSKTYFDGIGARSKTWTQAGLGHAIPNEKYLGDALAYLEAGAKVRAALAKKSPASRLTDTDREKMAQALLDEGSGRMKDPKTVYTGLMQLKGAMERWPDTAAGKKAKAVLLAHKDDSWEKDDLAEQRRFVTAQAKALDAYAMGALPPTYEKQRAAMLKQAIELYKQLGDAESKKRIEAIEKKLGE
jgi:predicted esterase